MSFYRRNLPHWQPDGAEYFVTFRLAGSLPREVVLNLKRQREELLNEAENSSHNADSLSVLRKKVHRHIFQKYDQLMNNAEAGPVWLENSGIAEIVKEAIHHRDQKEYDLYAFCVMPNHVHLVFKLFSIEQSGHVNKAYPVAKILQSLKWYSALEANKILNRKGSFWQPESYDHVIRDQDELERIISYTLNNPVKAGLVERWEDWPHNYCKPKFLSTFQGKTPDKLR